MMYTEDMLRPTAFSISEPDAPWYDFNLVGLVHPCDIIRDLDEWIDYHFGYDPNGHYEIVVSYASRDQLKNDPNEDYEPYVTLGIREFRNFYSRVMEQKKKDTYITIPFQSPPVLNPPPALPVVFEKEKIKKEETMAAPTASTTSSVFNTLKNSFGTAAKQVGSVVLAEKITDLVVGRLPIRIQKMIKVVPRPVLVFAVSEAVYMAAVRFEIPGRDRVRDISKHAVDGSMYDALKLLAKLLEPLFAAIRNLAPEDLRQLIDANNPPA